MKFKQIMFDVGGQHLDMFQSSYWFPERKLLMTLYVDDMVLSGPPQEMQSFSAELEKHLEIEPPTDVDRVLGRKHCF